MQHVTAADGYANASSLWLRGVSGIAKRLVERNGLARQAAHRRGRYGHPFKQFQGGHFLLPASWEPRFNPAQPLAPPEAEENPALLRPNE